MALLEVARTPNGVAKEWEVGRVSSARGISSNKITKTGFFLEIQKSFCFDHLFFHFAACFLFFISSKFWVELVNFQRFEKMKIAKYDPATLLTA